MSKRVMYVGLAGIIAIVAILIFFIPAKESIQEWGTTVPEESSTPANDSTFSASPTSGSAPLVVTFVSAYGDANAFPPSHVDGQDTVIDFGDGSKSEWVHCEKNGSLDERLCAMPKTVQHIYTSYGTYTATLKKSGGRCGGPCLETLYGTVAVTIR